MAEPPMTPGGRRRLAEREREKPYVPFNHRPKDVGTKTGQPMPKNVPKTIDGFEDPDEFFKSPTTTSTSRSIRGLTNGNIDKAQTPATGGNMRTKGRMSALGGDDEDGEEEFAADSLLGDDGDLLGDQLSTPARGSGPYFPDSNPPPSVSMPRRSQLPPPSPNIDFDSIPSPKKSVRKSVIGVAFDNHPSADHSSKRTNGSSSSLAPAPHIDGDDDVLADDIDETFTSNGDGNDLPDYGGDEEEEDDAAGVEMGRDAASRLSLASRKSNGKNKRGGGVDEIDPNADTDDEMVSEGGPSFRFDADDDEDGDGGMELEEAAMDYENGGDDQGDVDGEEEEEEEEEVRMPAKRSKSGAKGKGKENVGQTSKSRKTGAEGGNSKKKRTSLHQRLPLDDSETAVTGDFVTRRSGRQHFAPLAFWRGERFEYERGHVLPRIKEVVHVPEEPVEPFAARRKRGKSHRARSQSVRDNGRGGSYVPEEEGWDDETLPAGTVMEFASGKEISRRIAYPKSRLNPKQVNGANFNYQKVFGEERFIAAGVLNIPVGDSKPAKSSKDNAYVFYVISGAVNVKIHRTSFVIAPGGLFLVPRGNMYSIENISPDKEVKMFFAQGRKINAGEEDAPLLSKSVAESQKGGEEDEEEEETVPVRKKGKVGGKR